MPRLPSVLLDNSRSYVGLLQLDNASLPLFVHGAWAKERTPELLAAGLRRCDFRSYAAAINITCSSGKRGGSVDLPLASLDCVPLDFPMRVEVVRLLEEAARTGPRPPPGFR